MANGHVVILRDVGSELLETHAAGRLAGRPRPPATCSVVRPSRQHWVTVAPKFRAHIPDQILDPPEVAEEARPEVAVAPPRRPANPVRKRPPQAQPPLRSQPGQAGRPCAASCPRRSSSRPISDAGLDVAAAAQLASADFIAVHDLSVVMHGGGARAVSYCCSCVGIASGVFGRRLRLLVVRLPRCGHHPVEDLQLVASELRLRVRRSACCGTSSSWVPVWEAECWAIRWPRLAVGCCSSRRAAQHCRVCRGPFVPRCPKVAQARAGRSSATYYDALARAGRSTDEVEDISGRFLAAVRAVPWQRHGRAHRPSTAWCASDSSLRISLPGRTFAIPATPPSRMPGRSPTSRCGPGMPLLRRC